jgi:hypothetical protein
MDALRTHTASPRSFLEQLLFFGSALLWLPLEKAFSRHSLADAGFVKAASLRHSESLRPQEMP